MMQHYGQGQPQIGPQPIQMQQQQQAQEQPEKPNTSKMIAAEALPSMVKRGGMILGISILAFFGLWIAASFISALGGQAEQFFRHMTGLFHRAPYMFQSSNGFAAFVQLIAIAVFVGWTINRFMRKR